LIEEVGRREVFAATAQDKVMAHAGFHGAQHGRITGDDRLVDPWVGKKGKMNALLPDALGE
jgi:hypothetical protein